MRRALLTVCAVSIAAARLAAHDFWLAAADWRPAEGAPTTITAGIGEHFPTRTTFRVRENWLTEWRIVGANGDVPAAQSWRQDGLELVHAVSLPAPGAYLGVAVVTAQTIEMTGKDFTDYLKEEGLDAIVAARQAAGESDKTTTERYGRYAKIALRSGAGAAAHLTRPAGLRAEFVPSADPTSIRPGQPLTVQFLVGGAPAPGASVMAVNQGRALRAQTDAQGRATFAIDREGPWLIKTIHMTRLPAGSAVEWESSWATLTFHTAR
jgi:uncharacterized GH25 family protein